MPPNRERERDDWERWRGAVDTQMEMHANKIDEHCDRLTDVEKAVGAIMVKIAVPLFVTTILAAAVGGVIVAFVARALK